jgi:hypothetical protein
MTTSTLNYLLICLSEQILHAYEKPLDINAVEKPWKSYSVSTALRGAGEEMDSQCTPRGWHRIAQKIGEDAPYAAVFIGRQWNGEICTPEYFKQHPERDWILSRILWLTGLEEGKNLGGTHDSLNRYIYIHGTPDVCPMGIPLSHGCIRMRNRDVIELYPLVSLETKVYIQS